MATAPVRARGSTGAASGAAPAPARGLPLLARAAGTIVVGRRRPRTPYSRCRCVGPSRSLPQWRRRSDIAPSPVLPGLRAARVSSMLRNDLSAWWLDTLRVFAASGGLQYDFYSTERCLRLSRALAAAPRQLLKSNALLASVLPDASTITKRPSREKRYTCRSSHHT